jgi:hypothetical protein
MLPGPTRTKLTSLTHIQQVQRLYTWKDKFDLAIMRSYVLTGHGIGNVDVPPAPASYPFHNQIISVSPRDTVF